MKTVDRFDDRILVLPFGLRLKIDEINGTIRRVGTSNSDYFASLSRPNAPLSGIQVDSGVKGCSSQENWPIDRRFIPRPLTKLASLGLSLSLVCCAL